MKPTIKQRQSLHRYAFTWQLLTEEQNKQLLKCFYHYQDILEGTYSILGNDSGDYYEYLLFVEEMIECLDNYKTDLNSQEEWKPTDEFTTLYKLLEKLEKICTKRKIGRLFLDKFSPIEIKS
jgi:hypothetical protein